MKSSVKCATALCAVVALFACSDFPSASDRTGADDAVAFASVPVGYSLAQSTYGSDAEGTGPFMPHEHHGGVGRGPGPGMGRGMGEMIGGGLGGDFRGGPGLGREYGRGRFGDPALDTSTCVFNAANGRVECAATADPRGLTVVRSVSFTTAAGTAQAAFDSATTNTINSRVQVSGTITRRDGAVSVVSHAGDRTVTGLTTTQHTINGTASGTENTTGTDSLGAFTAQRAAADTIRSVVIPVSDAGHSYPIAGTIIRVMNVNVTQGNGATTTRARREVITFDGSASARMVITQDGTSRTCTMPLPFGRPTCE